MFVVSVCSRFKSILWSNYLAALWRPFPKLLPHPKNLTYKDCQSVESCITLLFFQFSWTYIVYHLNCRRVMCMIFHILMCIILSYEWVSNSNILMNDENYRRHWMPATGHIAIAAWEDVYTLQSLSTNFQWVLFKVEPCLVQIKTVWW